MPKVFRAVSQRSDTSVKRPLPSFRYRSTPSKITDDNEVEVSVVIQVDLTCTVGSPPALELQSCSLGSVRKNTVPVVDEQGTRIPVIGVVVGRRHLTADEGLFVLSYPEVEVGVAIDITDGQCCWLLEGPVGSVSSVGLVSYRPRSDCR